MTQKCLWRGVLTVALIVALATPVKANGYPSGGAIVAAVVAVVGALVVITVLVVHESTKKRSVTGCVNSAENGMSVTDEKDKRIYVLSGNTADLEQGVRVTLQGKKVNPKGASKPLAWEVTKEIKDFGVCQP